MQYTRTRNNGIGGIADDRFGRRVYIYIPRLSDLIIVTIIYILITLSENICYVIS